MPKSISPANMGLLKKTLDALPDGVLVVSPDREVIYVNDRFVSMWDIPDEVSDSRCDKALLDCIAPQIADVESFRERVEALYASHTETEDEVPLTDGRVFLRRGAFHTDEQGNTANIWIFSDITSLKAHERCSLTGVYNRRKFDEDFEETLNSLKSTEKLGIVIMDLDNFKQFNDNYGHQQGDYLLTDIGRLLRERLRRRGDTAYRIGGEEFLLICQSRSESHLYNFIDSIRREVVARGYPHVGNEPHGVVTFSAGIAFIKGGADADTIFEQVDKAMYEAKDKGRNRVFSVNV